MKFKSEFCADHTRRGDIVLVQPLLDEARRVLGIVVMMKDPALDGVWQHMLLEDVPVLERVHLALDLDDRAQRVTRKGTLQHVYKR